MWVILPLDKSLQPGRSWPLANFSLPAIFLDLQRHSPFGIFLYPRGKDVLAGPKLETELHSKPLNSKEELSFKLNSSHTYRLSLHRVYN